MRSAYSIVALIAALIGFMVSVSKVYGAAAFLGAVAVGCAIYGLVLVHRKTHGGRGLAIWGLIIGLLVLMGGLGGMTGSGTQAASTTASSPTATTAQRAAPVQPATPAAPIVVQPKKFGDEYEANQIAAERKWGGQFIQLTAPVGNINSSGVSFTDVTSTFSFTQVSCQVSDENQLVNLVKGRAATVRGTVSSDQLMGVITLNECEVVG